MEASAHARIGSEARCGRSGATRESVAYEIIYELGYGDGAATTAARGAAAEAAMNVDEGTGEDDAAWAAGEGDGLGGREGA